VTSLPIIGEKFLPTFAIDSFIALSAVLLAISVLGYAGGLTESKTAIEAYAFILAFATILMLMYSSLMAYYSNSFSSYYAANWGDLMLYVHKDSFSPGEMNCYGGKYYKNMNSTNYYDLKCSAKVEIAYMWENDIGKDVDD
jgi:hypothetical protein